MVEGLANAVERLNLETVVDHSEPLATPHECCVFTHDHPHLADSSSKCSRVFEQLSATKKKCERCRRPIQDSHHTDQWRSADNAAFCLTAA
jgi:hypothetical protein